MITEMQRHVCDYVHDLFSNQDVPPITDSWFWPSNCWLMDCIHTTVRSLRSVKHIRWCSRLCRSNVWHMFTDTFNNVHFIEVNLTIMCCVVCNTLIIRAKLLQLFKCFNPHVSEAAHVYSCLHQPIMSRIPGYCYDIWAATDGRRAQSDDFDPRGP